MGSRKGATASLDEIEQNIRGLSDEDLLRLERFARYQVFRYPSINPKEVLGEAVTRVLGGSRNWPLDVPFKVFFCNVIRSVADDLRNDARANTDGSGSNTDVHKCTARQGDGDDPAKLAADRALLAAIWKLFEKDDDVRALIQGAEEGLTAKEVQVRFGLSESRYGAARKRFERTLAKRYPNGMES